MYQSEETVAIDWNMYSMGVRGTWLYRCSAKKVIGLTGLAEGLDFTCVDDSYFMNEESVGCTAYYPAPA